MAHTSVHENFERSHAPRPSSNRTFGLVLGGFFVLLAVWPAVHRHPVRTWPLAPAAALLLAGLFAPAVLGPLNRLWSGLGELLSKIVNPVVTALIFFVIFTPAAWISRRLGRDPLRLRRDPGSDSYWTPVSPNLSTGDMRRQF